MYRVIYFFFQIKIMECLYGRHRRNITTLDGKDKSGIQICLQYPLLVIKGH